MHFDQNGEPLIALRQALYGEGGLFPEIKIADARKVFSRIIRIRSRYSRLGYSYVRESEYLSLKEQFNTK